MRRNKYPLLLSLLMLLTCLSAPAQEKQDLRQVYTKAEEAYQIGQLDHAIGLLTDNINDFTGNLRQSALRLVSICYLALDDKKESMKYAQMLLNINPYYTSVQDPIRFEDMIIQMKTGLGSTVTTASSQAESISEAPVPVTVITREMIDQLSNNKSIGQILAAYVPGLSEISTYSIDNVAMHGVYTSSQEKILVMENGHRLNMRATNNGKLDYAISTEKIDHIEVLRGPASSLYGNVALTAVVNIITKSGREVNGVKGKYGYSSYATHRADFIAGTTMMGADVMAWASLYASNGKQVNIPRETGYSMTKHDGYSYIGRYEGQPSYDFGCNITIKDISLMINRKNSKLVPQYSWYGETYDYDKYRMIDNNKPGYTTTETHLEAGYAKQIGKINFNLSVYGDWYHVLDYMPISDSLYNYILNNDGNIVVVDGVPQTKLYHGLSQALNYREYTLGGLSRANAPYSIGGMKGDFLVGAQFEYFKMSANDYYIGEEFEKFSVVYPVAKNVLHVGSEKSMSVFIQDKHYFMPELILNAGLRYDNKYRASGKYVSALSPRVALIYLPSKLFSTKLSYSRAFVDAPYHTRHNNSNGARGSEDLMPEYMNAVQLGFLGTVEKYHFSYDLNFFYNRLTDIIVNNPSTDPNTPKYINSGSLKVVGVEAQASYTVPSFRVNANMSYQRALDAEGYYYSDHRIYSVPSFMANLAFNKRLLKQNKHQVSLIGNAKYTSKTLNKANGRIQGSEDFELSGNAILDLGLKYSYNNFFQLSFDCDNVFDKKYYVGGSFYLPYQTIGRKAMATISIQL